MLTEGQFWELLQTHWRRPAGSTLHHLAERIEGVWPLLEESEDQKAKVIAYLLECGILAELDFLGLVRLVTELDSECKTVSQRREQRGDRKDHIVIP